MRKESDRTPFRPSVTEERVPGFIPGGSYTQTAAWESESRQKNSSIRPMDYHSQFDF